MYKHTFFQGPPPPPHHAQPSGPQTPVMNSSPNFMLNPPLIKCRVHYLRLCRASCVTITVPALRTALCSRNQRGRTARPLLIKQLATNRRPRTERTVIDKSRRQFLEPLPSDALPRDTHSHYITRGVRVHATRATVNHHLDLIYYLQ